MPVVNVIAAQPGAEELLEEVRFLVGGMRRADAADGAPAIAFGDLAQARRNQRQRLVPACRLQFAVLAALANQRRAQAFQAVDRIQVPAATVAEPTVVYAVVGTRI